MAMFRNLSRWAEKALAEMLTELLAQMPAETVLAKVFGCEAAEPDSGKTAQAATPLRDFGARKPQQLKWIPVPTQQALLVRPIGLPREGEMRGGA